MEILKKIDDLLIGWGISPSRADMLDQFIAFALILAVAFLADALCRKILLKVVAQLVKKTKATWDDIVFDRKVMVHLSRMVAPVIIYLFVPLAFVEVGSSAMDFIRRICLIYIIITFLSFVNSFLKAVYSVYSEKEQFRDRPLKGMLQTMQVILWLVGGIVVVGELIGRDPLSLLAGLGASAAIMMLVFKDSIMGFVSGVQLSANDMLRPGDWITMAKYGADGYVTEVSLTTVKVQNFDKTITTIPPYALVSDSFQNWRGMRECGGRRIKRSVLLDASTVRFCTPEGVMDFHVKGEVDNPPPGCVPWFEVPGRRSAQAVVVAGHWSALGLKILPNLLALDSGCLWGGPLSAVRLEDRAVFQVPCAAEDSRG